MEEDLEVALKIIIVGNGGVGKSSMIQRYCKGIFTKDYKKTIGVDFLEKQIESSDADVRLMLWDTAGQEDFDSITKSYYRGAHGCVIVFSLTDRDSFEAIQSWKRKVEAEVDPINMVLVENKIDVKELSVVSDEEIDELSRCLNLKLFRSSVKSNLNINQIFEHLTELCLNASSDGTEVDSPRGPTVKIGEDLIDAHCPTNDISIPDIQSKMSPNDNQAGRTKKRSSIIRLNPFRRRSTTRSKKRNVLSFNSCKTI